MKPPTFFLSSTIYDFKDLRSSIKYLLEQQGCKVLASEFNDFSKPLDTHSYEACLRAIQQADWFILLIGTRVGGWYDEPNRISITQQEYREAYRLHQLGKLKLLNFVRADVWRMKEDRKELSRYLETVGLDPGTKAKIVNHPTKNAGDAEFLSAFINEVSRNKETLAARSSGKALPTGNWIHVFDTFKDIVDAIQFLPFATVPVEEAALRRLLRQELKEILRTSLTRSASGTLVTPRYASMRFREHHQLSSADRKNGIFFANTELFDQICSYSIHLFGCNYYPQILPRALESSAFLCFDAASDGFKEQPVYTALAILGREIRLFTKANVSGTFDVVLSTSPKAMPHRGAEIQLQTDKVLPLLHVIDRSSNIIDLCVAIIKHLDGQPFAMPQLIPRSPLVDMDDKLNAEEASDEEVETILKG